MFTSNHNKMLTGILFVVLTASAASISMVDNAHGDVTVPSHKTKKGEKCVEPVDVMRRQHMEFILHQRNKTMHQGIRTSKYSLKNCVDCHADPVTNSVLGKDGFCESCHTYAAVTTDCFSCHTDKAQPDKKTDLNLKNTGRKLSVKKGGLK